MKQDLKKDIFFVSLLLLIAMTAFWQVSLLNNSFKWDMLDAYFPWRYFSGECLKNKILPIWNPYQQCGFPMYATLMSFWYPEETIIGFLFGFSIYVIHILFILYIFLAGLGAYSLLIYIKIDKQAAFLVAVAYMLSGFFVGHGQHFNYIIGGAWLPFVFLFYLKLIEKKSIINSILAALFLYLLISGGYPAIVIITGYYILVIFLYYLIFHIAKKNYLTVKSFILNNLVFLMVTIILSSGLMVTLFQVFPYIARFNELSYKLRNINSFAPQCFVSLFAPFAVTKGQVFFNNDISMSNIYFGIIPFLFFMVSLFRKVKGINILFFYLGVFSVIAAMGDHIPFISKLLYNYVPLMDKFRYPSVFRIFVILFFLLSAGRQLSDFLKRKESGILMLKISCLLLILLFMTVIVYVTSEMDSKEFTFFQLFKKRWTEIFNASTVYEQLVFQLFIQVIILGMFLVLLYRTKLRRTILPVILIIDMILSVQLNIHSTVVSAFDPSEIRQFITQKPKAFPLPYPGAIGKNTDASASFGPLCRNTNIYNKSISFDSYNPFLFKTYNRIDEEYTNLRDSILKNNVVYLSDSILAVSMMDSIKGAMRNVIFMDNDIYDRYKNIDFRISTGDTVVMTGFSPNQFEFITETQNICLISLLQSNYIGWKAIVDDRPQPVFASNLLFISTLLPEGKHKLVFHYDNKLIIILFFIINFTFIALWILIFIVKVKNISWIGRKRKIIISFIFPAIMVGIIGCVFFFRPTQNEIRRKVYDDFSKETINWLGALPSDSIYIYPYLDNSMEANKILHDTLFFTSSHYFIRESDDLSVLIQDVDSNYKPYVLVVCFSQSGSDEIVQLIKNKYTKVIQEKCYKGRRLLLLKNEGIDRSFKSVNTYDGNILFWDEKKSLVYQDTLFKLAEKLDTLNIYSSTFQVSANDIGFQGRCLTDISLDYKREDTAKSTLVIEHIKSDNPSRWLGYALQDGLTGINEWHKFTRLEKLVLDPGDKLKVYVWNNGLGNVYIDNLRIKILPLSEN